MIPIFRVNLPLSPTVVLVVWICIPVFISTSLLSLTPTDVSNSLHGDTAGRSMPPECLAGIEPAPISPEGQKPQTPPYVSGGSLLANTLGLSLT